MNEKKTLINKYKMSFNTYVDNIHGSFLFFFFLKTKCDNIYLVQARNCVLAVFEHRQPIERG
jgi:hypothetical protein